MNKSTGKNNAGSSISLTVKFGRPAVPMLDKHYNPMQYPNSVLPGWPVPLGRHRGLHQRSMPTRLPTETSTQYPSGLSRLTATRPSRGHQMKKYLDVLNLDMDIQHDNSHLYTPLSPPERATKGRATQGDDIRNNFTDAPPGRPTGKTGNIEILQVLGPVPARVPAPHRAAVEIFPTSSATSIPDAQMSPALPMLPSPAPTLPALRLPPPPLPLRLPPPALPTPRPSIKGADAAGREDAGQWEWQWEWQWEDAGHVWRSHSQDTQRELEEHFLNDINAPFEFATSPRFQVNFKRMTQTDMETSVPHKIRRVPHKIRRVPHKIRRVPKMQLLPPLLPQVPNPNPATKAPITDVRDAYQNSLVSQPEQMRRFRSYPQDITVLRGAPRQSAPGVHMKPEIAIPSGRMVRTVTGNALQQQTPPSDVVGGYLNVPQQMQQPGRVTPSNAVPNGYGAHIYQAAPERTDTVTRPIIRSAPFASEDNGLHTGNTSIPSALQRTKPLRESNISPVPWPRRNQVTRPGIGSGTIDAVHGSQPNVISQRTAAAWAPLVPQSYAPVADPTFTYDPTLTHGSTFPMLPPLAVPPPIPTAASLGIPPIVIPGRKRRLNRTRNQPSAPQDDWIEDDMFMNTGYGHMAQPLAPATITDVELLNTFQQRAEARPLQHTRHVFRPHSDVQMEYVSPSNDNDIRQRKRRRRDGKKPNSKSKNCGSLGDLDLVSADVMEHLLAGFLSFNELMALAPISKEIYLITRRSLNRVRSVKAITSLWEPSPEQFLQVGSLCPNLRCLSLADSRNFCLAESPGLLIQLSFMTPKLSELKLYRSGDISAGLKAAVEFANWNSLEVLVLEELTVKEPDLRAILLKLTNLSQFTLEYPYVPYSEPGYTDTPIMLSDDICHLLVQSKRMKKLQLSNFLFVSSSITLQISKLPLLEELTIEQMTDRDLLAIGRNCPRLSSLILQSKDITDQGFTAFVSLRPTLHHLDLACEQLTDKGLSEVRHLKDLLSFEIDSMKYVSAHSIRMVLQSCRKMDHLLVGLGLKSEGYDSTRPTNAFYLELAQIVGTSRYFEFIFDVNNRYPTSATDAFLNNLHKQYLNIRFFENQSVDF